MLDKKVIWNWFDKNNKYLNSLNEHERNVKLQKLLFISAGLYQAINNKPLCDTNFEAWTEGPVDNEVYAQIKNDDTLDKVEIDDSDIIDFLKKINNIFGIYSSCALSEMTHGFTSWIEAYKEDKGAFVPHIKMDKNKIAEDFKILYKNFNNFSDYTNDYKVMIINDITVLYDNKIEYDVIHQNYKELKKVCETMKKEKDYLVFVEKNKNGGLSYEV